MRCPRPALRARHALLAPLLALALAAPAAPAGAEPPAGGPPPTLVRTQAVTDGEVTEVRAFVGQVEPRRRARVASEYEGLVVERLVEPGDGVADQQPLVRLRTDELDRSLAVARALETEREQELLELENGARPEERAEAQARLALEEARLETLRWKQEAAESLRQKGAVSEDELRDAQLEARLAEQRVHQARAALALVLAGPRAERVEQARARLRAQQEEVRRLADQRERMTVRAPFAGRVVSLATERGQWVGAGDAVVELVDLAIVDVVVPVVEDWAPGLRLDQAVTIQVPALPGRLFEGRIDRVVPEGNPRTRAIPVRIRVPNEEVDGRPLLTAGMFVRASLPVGARRTATLVPKDALVLGQERPLVYALTPDGRGVRPVSVRIVGAQDGHVAVEGDLTAGDRVVVEGNERLRPGATVVEAPGAPR